jgi:hypothetical protein
MIRTTHALGSDLCLYHWVVTHINPQQYNHLTHATRAVDHRRVSPGLNSLLAASPGGVGRLLGPACSHIKLEVISIMAPFRASLLKANQIGQYAYFSDSKAVSGWRARGTPPI